jgi:hypothetical protein
MFDTEVDNCEDYDILLRSLAAGYIPYYTPSCKVFYRRHNKNITSNSLRQHLTDVKMHRRLDKLIDTLPTPRDRRLICHIAFAAGALKTAERIRRQYPATSKEMMEMSYRHLLVASNDQKLRRIKYTLPLRIFILMILSSPFLSSSKQTALSKDIQSEIYKIMNNICIPASPFYHLVEGFRKAITTHKVLFFERLLICHLSLKYFLNRYLPVIIKYYNNKRVPFRG